MRSLPLVLVLSLSACTKHDAVSEPAEPTQDGTELSTTLEPTSEHEASELQPVTTREDATPDDNKQAAAEQPAEPRREEASAAQPAATRGPGHAGLIQGGSGGEGKARSKDDADGDYEALAALSHDEAEESLGYLAESEPMPSASPPTAGRDSRVRSRKSASTGSSATRTASPHIGAVPPPPKPAPAPDTWSTGTESYTHYGVNPMTLASQDSQSTFSIDVDTASYSIARRKLREGVLPPTASVRVEEFVNAMDYGYAPPTGDAPFAVYMEATPNPFLDGHHVLRVGVQGAEIDDDDRKPVHLTFLVDVSGSMSSADKLGLARQSLHELVENLQPGDTVALATYAGHVSRVLSPTRVSGGNVRAIHRAIDGLDAGGSTGMSSGIDLAYEMASSSFVKGEENRVIVLSDGDANVGPSSHTAILEQIRGYSERGITLSTIGFGMGNYKDVMMEQLANQGDGNYFYIDSRAEAEEVFGEDLSGTLQVIAKDVKIQVEFNPTAVYSYRLIGYENRDIADRDFRNDEVDAGEIGAGHSVTALYDVVLADGGAEELATVRLRNKTPGPDSPAVEWTTIFPSELLYTGFDSSRADFRIAYGSATFAELLRGSPYGAEVSYSDLYDLVARAQRRGNAEDAELLELIARAGDLSGERGPVAWK